MAKVKGLKFAHEVLGPDKATIAAAMGELQDKLSAKFPMRVSVGKGKAKVTVEVVASL